LRHRPPANRPRFASRLPPGRWCQTSSGISTRSRFPSFHFSE
jgi:hypothetical protein